MADEPRPNPRRIVRKPLDTLPEDDRQLDARGRIVSTSDTEAVITAGDEGIPTQVNRARRFQVEYPGDLRPVAPERDLDALSAMQIGCARLLQGMTAYQLDLEALLDNPNDLQSRDWKLQRIFFDMPRQEDELEPYPSAVIMSPDRRVYERQDLKTVLLEDTLDVFGPGTVLRKLSHVQTTLEVTIWLATKEERRGVQAAVERTFLAEPAQDAQGRRVVVREAYDRVARFVLTDADYPDDQVLAQKKTWIAKLQLAADIDRVVLVASPGRMEPPNMPVGI